MSILQVGIDEALLILRQYDSGHDYECGVFLVGSCGDLSEQPGWWTVYHTFTVLDLCCGFDAMLAHTYKGVFWWPSYLSDNP